MRAASSSRVRERLLVHDAGVDEEHVEAEAGAVGHVAERGAGALHAAEDGHPVAESRVGEAQDFERRAPRKRALIGASAWRVIRTVIL